MFEVVREALIWLMSWILDRRPHSGEAFRIVSLLAFSVLATWIVLYWKRLAYRSAPIRRRLLPEERYTGRYLQALWRGNEARYAILTLSFDGAERRYRVAGRTYDAAGNEISSFRSSHVLLPTQKDAHIEFVWQGARKSSGYTRMSVDALEQDFIEGDGFVTTFEAQPKAYPLQFKLLRADYVLHDLGHPAPRGASDEPEFVRLFHARFGPLIRNKFAASTKHAA